MPAIYEKYPTFGLFIDGLAAEYGDFPAIVVSDKSRKEPGLLRMTYAEVAAEVQALEWGMLDLGVKPGERVGVMMSSFAEWILYLFAITRLGASFVPINPRFGNKELEFVLSHTGAETLVCMGRYLNRDYGQMITEIGGEWPRGGTSPKLPKLKRLIGLRELAHPAAVDTEELLKRGRELLKTKGKPPVETDPQVPAIHFYTSGTTSFPKGVPLSHANLLPHSVRAGDLLALKPGERVLTLYPFFGISGGANKVLSTFGAAACLVFQDSFRPQEAFELMEQENCTVIHAVDVQARELVEIAKKRGTPMPDRRGTFAFTAGVNEALVLEMGEVLGLKRFIHAYGMTETNPMVLRNLPDDPLEARVPAGGRVAQGVEVRVVDPDTDEDRPVGERGEIVVRGETVMKGYYNDPETNKIAFRNGWFHTGDLGEKTADGFIFYVGRIKDMLKPGGFNVAPQEVESFLKTHEAVADAAVAGAPDPRLGEAVVAFIKLRPGHNLTPQQLIDFCKGEIANYKTPKAVYLVDELPYHTAANGSKLQRHVLKDWARERAEAK